MQNTEHSDSRAGVYVAPEKIETEAHVRQCFQKCDYYFPTLKPIFPHITPCSEIHSLTKYNRLQEARNEDELLGQSGRRMHIILKEAEPRPELTSL